MYSPPREHCDCRKPHPKLLHEAASVFNIDIKSSFMVGDKSVDLEAGKNAGVRASILVLTGHGVTTAKDHSQLASFTGENLEVVANWILSQET